MVRSALGKVAWVGRTASMVFGLALVLALVLGVASMALGANGKPFLLGKRNVATLVSTLVNKGPGPALSLKVGAGQPPLAVNSSARVANLNAATAGRADSAASAGFAANANTLDNKDSSEFLGETEKAADADQLDGKDSSEFAGASEVAGQKSLVVDVRYTLPQNPNGTGSPKDLVSLTVDAPTDGFVVLTGGGSFNYIHTNGTATVPRAYLTTTSQGREFETQISTETPASSPGGSYIVPFSITRVMPVSAGENTFYLTGEATSGSADVHRPNLTGVFVKNQL